ncbi:MAG TPA: glycoside hydrolase family 2 protein, partial [Terriglobia bacterium]|nr:glycoside hydrolase family 2 protein [Terriglobia bacterium]
MGRSFSMDQNWLFGGKLRDLGALQPAFNDAAFSQVTLPHCVAKLSWQNWNPSDWEDVWVYRRHFDAPGEALRQRFFLRFESVMVGAAPVVNGHALPHHLGGYLPFQYEVTDLLRKSDNVLALAVDSRWSNAPPEGSPRGPHSIDYLEPGGILRPVRLLTLPQIFIADVFAKPVNVLDRDRRVEVTCSISAGARPEKAIEIEAALVQDGKVFSQTARTLRVEKTGETDVVLTLTRLGNVALWTVDRPRLYEVVVTLSAKGQPLDRHRTRIGFRD